MSRSDFTVWTSVIEAAEGIFVMPISRRAGRLIRHTAGAVLVSLTAAALLGGCSTREAGAEAAAKETLDEPIVIVDQRGKEHVFTEPVETIATTVIPAPSMIAAIDQSYDRVVGINESTIKRDEGSVFATMFPASLENTVISGSDFVPNVETIADLEAFAEEQTESPTAIYLRTAGDGGYNAGMSSKDAYMNTWMTMSGATNPAVDVEYQTASATSIEQIIEWDPEVIFVSAMSALVPEDIYNDPALAELQAVKNKKVYMSPSGGFWWDPPSAESTLSFIWAAQVLFPETADYDLRAEMVELYEYLYDYTLSDDEIDQILRFDMNGDAANYDQFTR